VIQHSEGSDIATSMSYDYHILVLRHSVLPKELLKPENMLWKLDVEGSPYSQNVITGGYMKLSRDDFAGVLRPEFESNIDFVALKKEYAAKHEKSQSRDNNIFHDQEPDDEDVHEYG